MGSLGSLTDLAREFGDLVAALFTLAGSVWASLRLRTDIAFNPTLDGGVERRAIRAISVALCIIVIVIAISFSRFNPEGFPWAAAVICSGLLAVIATILMLALRAGSTYPVQVREKDGVPIYHSAIGGLRLTSFAKQKKAEARKANIRWSPEALLKGKASNFDTVWSRRSRAALFCLLVASTIVMIGSTAGAVCFSAGWLVASASPATELRQSAEDLASWGGRLSASKSDDVLRITPAAIRIPVDPGAIPRDLSDARGRFESAWHRGQGERLRLDQPTIAKALSTLVVLCRKQEALTATKRATHKWLDEAIGHFRSRDDLRHQLAPFLRMKATVLLDEVQVLPIGSALRETKIEETFATLRQLITILDEEKNSPSVLAAYMRAYYERAKPGPDTGTGVWKADMLKETVRYGERLRNMATVDHTEEMGQLLAVYKRYLISKHREEGSITVGERDKLLKASTPILDEVVKRGPTTADYPFLVNYATNVHDHIFITTDPDDKGADLVAALDRLRRYAIDPLRDAKAIAEGDDGISLRSNIGDLYLDLARAHALEADLTDRLHQTNQKQAALTNASQCLRLIDSDDRVASTSRRRLLDELVSGRPEWDVMRDLKETKFLFDYAAAIAPRARPQTRPTTGK